MCSSRPGVLFLLAISHVLTITQFSFDVTHHILNKTVGFVEMPMNFIAFSDSAWLRNILSSRNPLQNAR